MRSAQIRQTSKLQEISRGKEDEEEEEKEKKEGEGSKISNFLRSCGRTFERNWAHIIATSEAYTNSSGAYNASLAL